MSIISIAALLFVIGVVLNAVTVNAGVPAWGTRVAWILWAVAAILWFATIASVGR